MAVGGISSDYNYSYNGYSSMINSNSWVDKANKEAEQIKQTAESKKTSSTSSTSSKVTSSSSTSSFLMGYQSVLEDLEAASSKLQIGQKDNVFQKYDEAVRKSAEIKVAEGENKDSSLNLVDKAADEVVAAVKDFAEKFNSAISFLEQNASRSSSVADQLASLKRAVPNEKTLKAAGMSVDSSGKLQVDEDKLKEALQKDSGAVKDVLGGQFGLADRVGTKASEILDSPVNKIVGNNASANSSSSTSGSSSSSSASASGTKANGMSDSFMQFANFARSGAFNLTNYYAVSMLNILA